MDAYSTDDETVAQLRKWWSENGPWILGGLALGAVTLFGWRYWVEFREQTYATASDAYEQVLIAGEEGDHARAAALAAEIRGLRIQTPYAELAALAVARHSVVAGDSAEAQLALAQLVETGRDRHVVHLARLRLARLLLAEGELESVTPLLTIRDTGRYAPLYAELRGDLALARGDREGAIAAYREALAGADAGISDEAMLEMKLNDLGATAAPREA